MSGIADETEPLAAVIRTQFLDELGHRAASQLGPSWQGLREQVVRLDSEFQETNAWRVKDAQGAFYFKVGCTLLAAYRTLLPRFDERQVLLDHIKAAVNHIQFQGGMDAFLLDNFGISPEAPEEAWDQICTNFIRRGRDRYGNSWVVQQGIRDDRRCFFNFTKCGFADFLLDNDGREVLYLVCATDYIWGDALERYGIRFERPTTLSEGADACRFQLFRMKEPKQNS